MFEKQTLRLKNVVGLKKIRFEMTWILDGLIEKNGLRLKKETKNKKGRLSVTRYLENHEHVNEKCVHPFPTWHQLLNPLTMLVTILYYTHK